MSIWPGGLARSLSQNRLRASADEADAALATGSYAVAIVDIGLPHLDGVEMIKRPRRRGNTMSVIILTANDAVSSFIRGLDSGADDYLVKRFDAQGLAEAIHAERVHQFTIEQRPCLSTKRR